MALVGAEGRGPGSWSSKCACPGSCWNEKLSEAVQAVAAAAPWRSRGCGSRAQSVAVRLLVERPDSAAPPWDPTQPREPLRHTAPFLRCSPPPPALAPSRPLPLPAPSAHLASSLVAPGHLQCVAVRHCLVPKLPSSAQQHRATKAPSRFACRRPALEGIEGRLGRERSRHRHHPVRQQPACAGWPRGPAGLVLWGAAALDCAALPALQRTSTCRL